MLVIPELYRFEYGDMKSVLTQTGGEFTASWSHKGSEGRIWFNRLSSDHYTCEKYHTYYYPLIIDEWHKGDPARFRGVKMLASIRMYLPNRFDKTQRVIARLEGKTLQITNDECRKFLGKMLHDKWKLDWSKAEDIFLP